MDRQELSCRLEQLADAYTYRVNELVSQGRDELVAEVAGQYAEDRDLLRRQAA